MRSSVCVCNKEAAASQWALIVAAPKLMGRTRNRPFVWTFICARACATLRECVNQLDEWREREKKLGSSHVRTHTHSMSANSLFVLMNCVQASERAKRPHECEVPHRIGPGRRRRFTAINEKVAARALTSVLNSHASERAAQKSQATREDKHTAKKKKKKKLERKHKQNVVVVCVCALFWHEDARGIHCATTVTQHNGRAYFLAH